MEEEGEEEGSSGGGGRQKRHRSRNFTKHEKQVFYAVFGRYAPTINDKRSSVDSIRQAWDQLLHDYNNQRNVYARTRRQLQVLWRDEKFRAKKRCRKEQIHGEETTLAAEEEEQEEQVERRRTRGRRGGRGGGEEEEEGRANGSLLAPLLTVITREHEAFTAAAAAAQSRPCSSDGPSPSSTTLAAFHHSPASPQHATNSNTASPHLLLPGEEGPPSPLPVETQLESCSSASPLIKQEEEDEEEAEAAPSAPRLLPGWGARPSPQHWPIANGPAAPHTPASEARELEYHKARMAQLREEGAARLRVLEAELALHHQERHLRQQEHQLRMQILVERLRRLREGPQ